jgi:hypothetical protein
MFRLICLGFLVCSFGVGSPAAAQSPSLGIVGTYDISENRNAPGDSPYVNLELTAEAGREAPRSVNTDYFRYRARLRDGRAESGTWWMAGDRSGGGYLMLHADGARRHVQVALYAIDELATTCALRTRPVQGRRWNTVVEQVYVRRACRVQRDVQVHTNVQVAVTTPGPSAHLNPFAQEAPPRARAHQSTPLNPFAQGAPGTTSPNDVVLSDRQVLRAAHVRIRRCFDPAVRTRLTIRARIGAEGRVLGSVVNPRSGQDVPQRALRCAERVVDGLRLRPGVRTITTPIAFEPS